MTTHAPTRATRPQTKPAKPLSFDERLALAAVEFDSRSGINPQPVDYADVIRIPVETPTPAAAPCPYRTPLAGVLHRARVRIESGGWCKGARRDEKGAVCLAEAIRLEAASSSEDADARALLLDVIRRDFPNATTIPSWQDGQRDPRLPLRYLDRAASFADARLI